MDCVEFQKDYAAFVDLLLTDERTKAMGTYLIEHYSNCTKQWSYCHRKQCGISTNMHLENMHKNLKYTYLEGKKVKRLDKSLHLLQKLIRDKTIDRLIKLTKGKTTKHAHQINAQHRLALTLKADIKLETLDQFLVKVPNNQEHFVSRKLANFCCNLKCVYCNVCIHTFECTCIDFNIKNIICKHIHSVCLNMFAVEPSQIKSKIDCENELKTIVSDSSLTLPSKPSKEKIIEEIELNLLGVISKIKNGDQSDDQLLSILEKSRNLKGLINIETKNVKFENIQNIRKGPSNKNITKQVFYSTKKRNYKYNNNKIPDKEEEQIIEEVLRGTEVLSSSSLNDHCYL